MEKFYEWKHTCMHCMYIQICSTLLPTFIWCPNKCNTIRIHVHQNLQMLRCSAIHTYAVAKSMLAERIFIHNELTIECVFRCRYYAINAEQFVYIFIRCICTVGILGINVFDRWEPCLWRLVPSLSLSLSLFLSLSSTLSYNSAIIKML